MAGFAGNEQDGFEALMADVESANNNVVVETGEDAPAPIVETQLDVPVMQDSPIVEVAPQQVVETPVLRQESPQQEIAPVVDFEHKYKTLQGMHQADKGQADERLATLQAQLDAERNARVNAEQQLAEVPLDYAEIMGDEAYDDLGEGAVDGISKVIQAQVAKELAGIKGENDQLKSIIGNLQDGFNQKSENEEALREDTESIMHDQRVTAEVPEFLSLVKDKAFAEWLGGEVDSISGASMFTVFDDADKAMNSGFVANICKLYIKQRELKQADAYDKSEHVAPSLNSTTPESVVKPVMYWKDYNSMTDRFMNQNVSDNEYVAFTNAFEQAKLDGRVQ
jgi:hypothetical protein